MKKNILTIIILAITLINAILTAVLIFVIVPTSNKTNQLVTKVASIVNLELEDPQQAEADIAVSDIETYKIADKLTIKLSSQDGSSHYAVLYVSLSMNSKHKDYVTLNPKIVENEGAITEIVSEEFEKYSMDEVNANKDAIKAQVLARIQELFKSDFIINISFGNIVYS